MIVDIEFVKVNLVLKFEFLKENVVIEVNVIYLLMMDNGVVMLVSVIYKFKVGKIGEEMKE